MGETRFPCWEDCHFPRWAGGCPYLYVRGAECDYYGEDCREEGETFLRGGGIMDYVNFYRAIREYAGGKISRQRFVLEWELEQRRQGIKEAGT